MLFSDSQIAAYINENFEAVWQKVREVPQVTIDFGNGKVIKRTLHGNVATYICTPDGNVLDILPGVYKANQYLARLKELDAAAESVSQGKFETVSYHQEHLYRLDRLAEKEHRSRPMDVSKARVERPVETLLTPHPVTAAVRSKSIGSWEELQVDTSLNEMTRRRQIHERLARGKATPQEITHWLYREVLQADLDDPYLGLGPTLFSSYPFGDRPES